MSVEVNELMEIGKRGMTQGEKEGKEREIQVKDIGREEERDRDNGNCSLLILARIALPQRLRFPLLAG